MRFASRARADAGYMLFCSICNLRSSRVIPALARCLLLSSAMHGVWAYLGFDVPNLYNSSRRSYLTTDRQT